MKIGIYGGTFAPPHRGHLHAAREFVSQLSLDKLYIIPDRIPPHKAVGEGDDPAVRYEMARLGFASLDGYGESVFVSDIELKREGKSYTLDTLKCFSGEGDLYLLCGTDMLMCFEKWYKFEEIFKLCTLVVCLREDASAEERKAVDAKIRGFERDCSARIKLLSGDAFPVSSTQVRDMIKRGADAREFLEKDVYDYIKEKGLYR